MLLMYKKCQKIETWRRLGLVMTKKSVCSENLGQNIWNKVKKSRKIGQD